MFFGSSLALLANRSTRDKPPIRLLQSSTIMASGISTTFLPQNPNELCDRLKLLPQKKPAGKNSDLIDEKIVAIADELLEFKCISTKQHRFLIINCLNLMESMKLIESF